MNTDSITLHDIMIRCQATNKSSPKEIGNATSLPQVPFSALSSKISKIKYFFDGKRIYIKIVFDWSLLQFPLQTQILQA